MCKLQRKRLCGRCVRCRYANGHLRGTVSASAGNGSHSRVEERKHDKPAVPGVREEEKCVEGHKRFEIGGTR
jgi:hypothetical protein